MARDTRTSYERAKILTVRLRAGEAMRNGKIAMENKEVLDGWKKYIEDLFKDEKLDGCRNYWSYHWRG